MSDWTNIYNWDIYITVLGLSSCLCSKPTRCNIDAIFLDLAGFRCLKTLNDSGIITFNAYKFVLKSANIITNHEFGSRSTTVHYIQFKLNNYYQILYKTNVSDDKNNDFESSILIQIYEIRIQSNYWTPLESFQFQF